MPEKKFGSEGKLFIGGLTYNTTDEMLKDYYSQWGRLVDFIVMKDPDTKRSRGFGFVTYGEAVCADLAMDNRPHILDGKTVEAKRAMPRESDPSAPPARSSKGDKSPSVKRLFLSGVKEEHTDKMFLEYFGQFGNVLTVDIVVDKNTGRKRGFGYITFDSVEAVEKSIVNKSHMVGGLRCDVKKALSRDEMGKSSNQYGRDRMERDSRSRGSGRGDGYGYGGGYQHQSGGGYGNGYSQSQQQAPGGGSYGQSGGAGYNQSSAPSSWNQGGGPATTTYYPPSYGSGGGASSGYSSSSYGSSVPSYGQPSPQAPSAYPPSGGATYAPAGSYGSGGGGATSYGQPGSYPPSWSGGQTAASGGWSGQQQQQQQPASVTGWGQPQQAPAGWSSSQQPSAAATAGSWGQQPAQSGGWAQSAPQSRSVAPMGGSWSSPQAAVGVYRR